MQKIKAFSITSFFLFFSCYNAFTQVPLFTEVSVEKGLDYIYPGNDFQMAGGGVMIIDVNNDGWEDIFQSGGVFDSKLWINHNGVFEDGTSAFGLDSLKGYYIQGTVAADYNNDGYRDFIIANYGTGMGRGDKHTPVLLKNIQGKGFELVDLSSIINPGNYTSASWGDFNKDGFVDVYITNYVASMGGLSDENGVLIGYDPICFDNVLLMNLNGEGFRECAKEYGVNDLGCGLASSFTDVDNDGNLDLLLLNDFGEWTHLGNKFFRNEFPNKRFSDQSESSGFNHLMYGMGIGQGDYNLDGKLDYYLTNIGQNFLMSYSEGKFTDIAKEKNIDITFVKDSILGTSWSALFFDLEFDGDLDLYVSKGFIATLVPKTVVKDPNKLFINNNGDFRDSSSSSGINDVLSHRGAAIFDFDHDGDLDIVSSVVKMPWSAFANMDQKIKLYQNNVNTGNYIGIKLTGQDGINRDCIGCKVVFETKSGPMVREVDGGSGQASQSSPILYCGLGEDKVLKSAVIYWTNGTSLTLKKLKSGCIYEIASRGRIKKMKM